MTDRPTDDDLPNVDCVTVVCRKGEDGLPVYSAACHDWLSILDHRSVAAILAQCADATLLLAEHFDPDVLKGDRPAPVVQLVPNDGGDDGAA